MFHKVGCFVLFLGAFAWFNAAGAANQIVTSEIFYDSDEYVQQEDYAPENVQTDYVESEPIEYEEYDYDYDYADVAREPGDVPVWPLAGSDADVEIACAGAGCGGNKIVTKVGSGLVIENNIHASGTGWSGGPDISNGIMIPAGFDYECANDAEMPLMNREMMEDDGGSVLAMSRSGRKNCNKRGDSYAVFAEKAGFKPESDYNIKTEDGALMGVNANVEAEAPAKVQDQVRSWVVMDGQTLREVLQSWCDKEGWDLVWTTAREYPIEASAVFKGRFVDVASALVRNFERATPVPYAKFYKGNRVIVVSTIED